jgi:hypothetical protein
MPDAAPRSRCFEAAELLVLLPEEVGSSKVPLSLPGNVVGGVEVLRGSGLLLLLLEA